MEALAWLALEADRPDLVIALAFHSRATTRNADLETEGEPGAGGDAGHTTSHLQALLRYGEALGFPLAQGPPASPSGLRQGAQPRMAGPPAHPQALRQPYTQEQGAHCPQSTRPCFKAMPTLPPHVGMTPATPSTTTLTFPEQPPPGASPFGALGTHYSPAPTLPPGGWRAHGTSHGAAGMGRPF